MDGESLSRKEKRGDSAGPSAPPVAAKDAAIAACLDLAVRGEAHAEMGVRAKWGRSLRADSEEASGW